MSKKKPKPSARVLDEWTRRIEAEYRSASTTAELSHWLIVLGAPEALVRDAMRIVADELAHARLSHAVARAAGLASSPHIERASLVLPRAQGESIERAALRVVLEVFCLGETIAVRLFSAMRKGCEVPVAKRALDRILRDEVRHRDFGWEALAFLLEREPSLRAQVEAELPHMLERQRRSYAPEGLEREKKLDPEERCWGLLPGSEYAAITKRTPERDYAPRLAKLGLALPTGS